jgi:hypothetical protein
VRRTTRELRFYTPQEVGKMTGFSASFIRGEIKAGELKAVFVCSTGRRMGRWRIRQEDATAYAAKLGVLAPERATSGF